MSSSGEKRQRRRKLLSRRGLLTLAPVAGVGAVGAGLALYGRGAEARQQVRGVCRFCLMRCGVVASVEGERLVRVEGDAASKTRGFLCIHGHALREVVHSDQRVRRPLMRKGERWVELSWPDALGEVASRLSRIRAEAGPESFAVQTGWPLVRHPLIGLLHRFCQAFGTPNLATVASLCEAAGRMGKALTVGSKYRPDLPRTRTLVVWGANPTNAAPPFAHLVAQKAQTGNLIVVDPVRTALARESTLHLSVRPGTDGALALGMMHLLLAEGLHDRDFVRSHTVGFESLAALAREYPPERVTALTGVPRELLERAVRLMAREGPTGFWEGLGVEHHENGVQTVRAISCLDALLGHLDSPGGAVFLTPVGPRFHEEPLPALYRMTTPEPVPPPVSARPLGYDEFPLFEVYNREAQGNLLARAILEERPYPVRALMLVASNALVTAPGSKRLREAARKLELLVTVDPFLSASAELSHFVLPAATFAEAPTVDETEQEVARGGLVSPQHEAWPDWKVLFELARALGLGRYFPWSSFREAMEAPRVPFMEDPSHQPRPHPPTGAEPARFPTPSGKVEFESALVARAGRAALPVWTPPSVSPSADFPLWLVSGPRTRAYINSQFRGIPTVQAKQPRPEVELHPQAARAAGVQQGQRVAVVTPVGRIELGVRVTEDVHPEAAVLPAGWSEANANELTDDGRLDPLSGFPAFRSGVCRVEPA